jgi:predicted ATPase
MELAEADFRKVIDSAREIGAKAFELRAAVGLARLLHGRNRKAAYDLLATVYAQFSEGFDSADIKGAKGLLDVLNGKSLTTR